MGGTGLLVGFTGQRLLSGPQTNVIHHPHLEFFPAFTAHMYHPPINTYPFRVVMVLPGQGGHNLLGPQGCPPAFHNGLQSRTPLLSFSPDTALANGSPADARQNHRHLFIGQQAA